MGHDIIECDFCGRHVMEGSGDWECKCGAVCSRSTGFAWMHKKMKKNDCLMTPPEIIQHLGVVDLDPCAGVSTYIGKTNYAIERGEDGLKLPWSGFVYCNPPFSQKELWAKKKWQNTETDY